MLIQRVGSARVEIEDQCTGSIGRGALVFFAVHRDDEPSQVSFLANKLIHLRMFHDEADKMNLSLMDVKGEVLIVSQFTLYADCTQGRRPSFFESAPPDLARAYYDSFILEVKKSGLKIESGIFGANMQVHLINDGPVTLIVDAPKF
jgi:D-tyrosyl-tRNA(Tyr) deacylase